MDYMENRFIHDSIIANVSESFSHKENKHVGAGSGETRFYMGPQQNADVDKFIEFDNQYPTYANNKEYPTCRADFIITKDNLLSYHQSVKEDYKSSDFENTIGKIAKLYDARLEEILRLNKINRFEVFNQNGALDDARIYIGSQSYYWDLIRRIALPKISSFKIDKMSDIDGELVYVLSVFRKDSNLKNDSISESSDLIAMTDDLIEEEINKSVQLSETEKRELILARRGQGKFRRQVLNLMKRCPFTGISEPSLLRASHCIPWRECESASDRLDGYNGLLLTPTYDVLFDQGYIAFNDDGSLLISKFLGDDNKEILGLVADKKYITEEMQLEMRKRFLAYHRQFIFKDNRGRNGK